MPTLPDGWPAPSPFETLPGVYVTLPDLGTRAVSSWKLERELTGSLLPSSVRSASGLSIGSASMALPAPGASPWSTTMPVSVGADAELFAAHDGPDGARVSLGAWQVAPVSGSLTSNEIGVELIEKQYRGRVQTNALPVYGTGAGVDPSWMIEQLAAQLGFDVAHRDIQPLGGLLPAPWIPGDTDAWTGIQDICAAWLGAAWVTADGVLIVRSRDYLSAAGSVGIPVDVGTSVENLAWSLDPDDTADRLEITYAPAGQAVSASPMPTAWSASDPVSIAPGASVDVVADLDRYSVANTTTWADITNVADVTPHNAKSIFAIGAKLDGTDPRPGVVTVTSRQVSAGRVVITLTNTSNTTLYTVDGTGQACLLLRCPTAPQETTATIERGAAADEATSPLSIDLGKLVQRAQDAEEIADFIWPRVSVPAWKASSVRIRLDWEIDLGDILLLSHERSDLTAKALVTKVAFDGSPGEVQQTLDLVLLATTWGAFDRTWAGLTWDDFDAAWAGATWDDFDADPTSTTGAP